MSTTTAALPRKTALGTTDDPYAHRYLIALTVTLASMLELLDTSIVNVAIPHMMGTLGATLDQIAWVSTGYVVANVIVLPLEFMSGIFVPSEQIPDWMDTIASVFPVKPLFDSLFAAFDPLAGGIGVAWGDLAVVAAWGVAGVLLALRSFRWSPNR